MLRFLLSFLGVSLSYRVVVLVGDLDVSVSLYQTLVGVVTVWM